MIDFLRDNFLFLFPMISVITIVIATWLNKEPKDEKRALIK